MKRRNNSDIPAQAFLLAAATILAVLVVSILISQYNQSRDLTNTVTKNMVDATNEIKNSNIEQYDGLIVTGSDVVNFYKRYIYSGEETFTLTVVVQNNGAAKATQTYKYADGETTLKTKLGYITTATNTAYYINPIASFKGTVDYNKNGIITGVKFEIQ